MRSVSVLSFDDKPVNPPQVEQFIMEMKLTDVAPIVIPMMGSLSRRMFITGFLSGALLGAGAVWFFK